MLHMVQILFFDDSSRKRAYISYPLLHFYDTHENAFNVRKIQIILHWTGYAEKTSKI